MGKLEYPSATRNILVTTTKGKQLYLSQHQLDSRTYKNVDVLSNPGPAEKILPLRPPRIRRSKGIRALQREVREEEAALAALRKRPLPLPPSRMAPPPPIEIENIEMPAPKKELKRKLKRVKAAEKELSKAAKNLEELTKSGRRKGTRHLREYKF